MRELHYSPNSIMPNSKYMVWFPRIVQNSTNVAHDGGGL